MSSTLRAKTVLVAGRGGGMARGSGHGDAIGRGAHVVGDRRDRAAMADVSADFARITVADA